VRDILWLAGIVLGVIVWLPWYAGRAALARLVGHALASEKGS